MQIGKVYNEALKQAFIYLHPKIVTSIDPDSIMNVLLSKNIICFDDYCTLCYVPDSRSRCRDLLKILYCSAHPETFIQLRLALPVDCHWIVRAIDEQPTSATAQIHLGDSADGRLVSVNSS